MRIRQLLIFWCVLVAILPIAIVAVVVHLSAQRSLQHQILNRISIIATNSKTEVGAQLERYADRLKLVTDRGSVKRMFETYLSTNSKSALSNLRDALSELLEVIPSFRRISLISQNGKVLVSSDRAYEGTNFTDFSSLIERSGSAEGFFPFHYENSEIGLYLYAPMANSKHTLAWVVVESTSTELWTLLSKGHGLGSSEEFYLVTKDAQGNGVLLSPLRYAPGAPLKLVIDKSTEDSAIMKALANYEETFLNAIDYRNMPVVAATRVIDPPGWGLVAQVDTQEVFAPLLRAQRLVTAIVLFVILAVVLLAIALARYITRPLAQLSGGLARVREGDFSHAMQTERVRELNELAAGFTEMSASLRAAEQAQHVLTSLMQQSADAVIGTDNTGMINAWNPGACEIYGYKASEILGKKVTVLAPAEGKEEVGVLLKRILNKESILDHTARRITKDGRSIWVSISASPLVDRSGEVYGVSAVHRDITESRAAEERFRLAVEAAPNSMIMTDSTGEMVLVNQQTETIFRYSRAELIGRPIEMLIPERFRSTHPEFRGSIGVEQSTQLNGERRDLCGLRKDGLEIPLEVGFTPITSDGQKYVLSAIVDISERKNAELRLQKSLSEKETLLKEIHHRVKNNLQVISSLLKLQADYCNVNDNTVRGMFEDSELRVRSMALVHEKLYRSESLSDIDLRAYVEDLVNEVSRSVSSKTRISLKLDLSDVRLAIEQAVPCGLLLNELLINAYKHGFKGRESGCVSVKLAEQDEQVALEVADDGTGIPDSINLTSPDTLGLELINTLVRQLGGQHAWQVRDGTLFTLTFKPKHKLFGRRHADGNGARHINM